MAFSKVDHLNQVMEKRFLECDTDEKITMKNED